MALLSPGKLSPAENIQPVRFLETDAPSQPPRPGIGLCLSGGGYRAMLFHVGAIWRLNELGLLRKEIIVAGAPATVPQRLVRVSSVSGGSITAGILALNWKSLTFDAANVATNLDQLVVSPIRKLAGITVDVGAIICGKLVPGRTVSANVAASYRKHLFGNATLQNIPADSEGPRFVINATSLQSKVLWRFSKPFMGDYRVGLIRNPQMDLATAVAASSAFPPLLSPARLKLNPADFDPTTAPTKDSLQFEPYTSDVRLTDGGVYDNLGLETVWKSCDTVLVSDGGGGTDDEPRPASEWVAQAYRVLNLIDNQVRSLRKRQTIASYQMGLRRGTYWGIRTNILDYELPNVLPCPFEQTLILANTATRLKRLPSILQERLINWGYAVTDAAIRRHVVPTAPPPVSFPYPAAKVG